MATYPTTSSIAMALAAGKTQSVDIPRSHNDVSVSAGNKQLTVAPDGGSRVGYGEPNMLPTPPNSVSPSFNPQFFKRYSALPDSPPLAPAHVESDLDLQDGGHHNPHFSTTAAPTTTTTSTPLVAEALSGLESTDTITPALLAKHYLPHILLSDGPLAIRHIMSQLTTSVPGFSRIPPTKARRLVGAALEGKSFGGEVGAVNSEVKFEKVGWGRWGAHRLDQAGKITSSTGYPGQMASSSPVGSMPSGPENQRLMPAGRDAIDNQAVYGSSMAGDSAVFSHSDFEYDDHDMLENEADKMSLDGNENGYCSSSVPPEEDVAFDGDWEEVDMTDEEDWAQIGADALRARSFPNASEGGQHLGAKNSTSRSKGRHGGGPPYPELTKSVPGGIPVPPVGFSFPNDVGENMEERTAVEALLRLGSM